MTTNDYLLDTHIMLWWLSDPERIAPEAQQIIAERSNHIYISSASFWELAIKESIGRIKIPNTLLETLDKEGFKSLEITAADALAVSDLPFIHKDPFDRMLVTQAKRYDCTLITHDKTLQEYPVQILLA